MPLESEDVYNPVLASDRRERGNLIEVAEIAMLHSGLKIPRGKLGFITKLPLERKDVDNLVLASDRRERGNLIEVAEIVILHSGLKILAAN